jgi:hypothetical protein
MPIRVATIASRERVIFHAFLYSGQCYIDVRGAPQIIFRFTQHQL